MDDTLEQHWGALLQKGEIEEGGGACPCGGRGALSLFKRGAIFFRGGGVGGPLDLSPVFCN